MTNLIVDASFFFFFFFFKLCFSLKTAALPSTDAPAFLSLTHMRSSGNWGQPWCHRKLYQTGSGIMATRQQSSKAWKHFKKTKEKSVQCNICKAEFAFHGSTTAMHEHLKRKHVVANCDNNEEGPESL